MKWEIWPWPFFESRHRDLAKDLTKWQVPEVDEDADDLEPACRTIAGDLASSGYLDLMVPTGPEDSVDLRSVCLAREAVAYQSVLADEVLAMQGIGAGAIWMHGTPAQKEKYLGPIRSGTAIAGFALTEPASGSDVANITTTAERRGEGYVLNGTKTFISNAPFADHYIVVARTGESPGGKGLSAFVIDKGTEGLVPGDPIPLIAPHPLAPLDFRDCYLPAEAMIGEPGKGFGIAMATFDIFRTSVGAAAVGMARRARDEALDRVTSRILFGDTMAKLHGVQTSLAEIEIDLTTAALSVYSAAWNRDTGNGRVKRDASLAKYVGTEHAGRIIDAVLQLFGGQGVTRGCIIEKLYREARAARIYEGASEVQKIVIARDVLMAAGQQG